ncbi:Solute carrier family 35 [Seminavis robusta]|uniref:Solute carrier family 35 n=1 Tax=Seminavis robusta TaxID=568900 RepID=A0A9N8E375_9STRA|nr:Solute carrier family 35 [Seminavis robusta]|eukprot:Sro457_g146860.1 Solute carrier family 35 (366) ;mRNA; f:30642-31739
MASSAPPSLDGRAMSYMFLLALQFGFQPALTRQFTPSGINRSTVILVQEIMKFGFAASMLRLSSTPDEIAKLYQRWSLGEWFQVAAVPAGLYAVQNVAALTAYQHLDALTFNVLNQTKTLSAALCCYVVMGRRQSVMQVLALLLLLVSALIMEGVLPLPGSDGSTSTSSSSSSEDDTQSNWDTQHLTYGVFPILLASFISGLAGALSQKNLQSAGGGRNPYQFSMELCAASATMLGLKLAVNSISSGHNNSKSVIGGGSMWEGWTLATLIPIATNSAGGIVVGLVTKYAGSVRKGFALIFGILLSGLVQEFVTKEEGGGSVRPEQIVGGLIAAVSLYLHATNPPRPSTSSSPSSSSSVDDTKKTN